METVHVSALRRIGSPLGGAVHRALALALLIVLAAAAWRMLPASGSDEAGAATQPMAAHQEPTGGERTAEAPPLPAPALRVVDENPSVPAVETKPPPTPEPPSNETAQTSFPPTIARYNSPARAFVSEFDAPQPEPAPLSPSAPPAAPEDTGAVTADRAIPSDAAPERDLVDLNSASLAQLNDLRGVGPIGRAIIRGRPYATSEDLVQKRVLRRSTYERMKDQVTVR
jgi:DNA uptake protein ComE-like DNA-binding protein